MERPSGIEPSERDGYTLNGSDAFMLAMDYAMRKEGTSGNVCHILLTLAPSLTEPTETAETTATIADHQGSIDQIIFALSANPEFIRLTSLRLVKPLFQPPRWRRLPAPSSPAPKLAPQQTPAHVREVPLKTEIELQQAILAHTIDPRHEPPFGAWYLPHYERGCSIVFFWHHALTDAKGGEALVSLFSHRTSTLSLPSTTGTQTLPIDGATLQTARRALVRTLFAKASPKIAVFSTTKRASPKQRYKKISFSPQESTAIDSLSRTLTNGMFPTAMYLAATARAAAPLFTTSPKSGTGSTTECPIFIPVPLEIRRHTKETSPLSNQVSFLFFSLRISAQNTLRTDTDNCIDQMHGSLAENLQWGMLGLLYKVSRLPSWLAWQIFEKPTRGHPASLYFSDIGHTFRGLKSFLGAEVLHATHYPPHITPPGLTTVWSRCNDALEVTICYDEARLGGESGIEQFVANLRTELLPEPAV